MSNYKVTQYFKEERFLKKYLPQFNYRQSQVDMAETLEDALNCNKTVAIEAPTGYGKTFAYLIAAIASNKRVIISTKTKQLMNQLVEKDIPLILKMMASSKKVVSLKGRSNYFCELKYEKEVAGSLLYPDLIEWYNEKRKSGEDIIEVPYEIFSEDAIKMTATHYQCRSRNCKYFNSCAFYTMRKEANDADIVITNHYLLLSDLAIKNDSSEGGIFEERDAVIFDEAHSLIDIFTDLSGASLPLHSMLTFFNEYKLIIDKVPDSDLFSTFQDLHSKLWASYNNISIAMRRELTLKFDDLKDQLEKYILLAKELHFFLKDNFNRIISLVAEELTEAERSTFLEEHKKDSFDDELLKYFSNYEKISNYSCDEAISIVERAEGKLSLIPITLRAIMYDVADLFKKGIDSLAKSSIYLSATLTSNILNNSEEGGFAFFLKGLGLYGVCEGFSLPPVFNYREQARLYVPNITDDTNEGRKKADERRDNFYKDFIPKSSGSTLIICNSTDRMKWVYSILSSLKLSQAVYSQNNTNLGKLSFDNGDIVLIGTASVREGLDIANGSFRTVILDRLPFESHRGVVAEARQAHIESHGGNVFFDMSLPRAVLFFKQATGRLIRHESDFGLWVVLDERIIKKKYGKNFINVLNNTVMVNRYDEAISFIRRS